MRSTQIAQVLVSGPVLACALPALAGALSPCVKAVGSNNGNFLVITDVQWEPEQREDTFRARRVSLLVFPKENFINAKDRVSAPVTYWANGAQWSAVLDSSNSHPVPGCPPVTHHR